MTDLRQSITDIKAENHWSDDKLAGCLAVPTEEYRRWLAGRPPETRRQAGYHRQIEARATAFIDGYTGPSVLRPLQTRSGKRESALPRLQKASKVR